MFFCSSIVIEGFGTFFVFKKHTKTTKQPKKQLKTQVKATKSE